MGAVFASPDTVLVAMLPQVNCWWEEKNSNNSKPIKINSVTIFMSIFRLILVAFSALLISFGNEITQVPSTERSGEASIAVIDKDTTGAQPKDWHAIGGRRLQRRCGSLSNYSDVDWPTDQPASQSALFSLLHGYAVALTGGIRLTDPFRPVLHGACRALHLCSVF